MIFLDYILFLIVFTTVVVSGSMGAYLLLKQAPYKILGAILLTSSIWSGLTIMLISKVFSINPLILLGLQSLALSITSILWLDFSLSYSVLKKQWYHLGLNFAYVILAFTVSSLFIYNFNSSTTNQLNQVVKIAWVFSSFLQLTILATSIYLLRRASLYIPNQDKYQFRALILAIVLPFLAILLHLTQGFNDFVANDYYSLALILFVSNTSLLMALFRNKLIESLPNTYQSLFNSNNNSIILLDRQANIINYNSSAKLFLQELSTAPVGQNIYKLIPTLPSKEEHFKDIAVNIFSYDLENLEIFADISFYPVKSLGFRINAYILEIKDVSSHIIDFRQIEQLSKFQQALISLSNQTSEHNISNSFYQIVLEHAVKLIPNADIGSVVLKSSDGKFKYVAAVGFPLANVKDIHYLEEQVFFGEFQKHENPIVKRHDEGLEKSHIDRAQFKELKKALPIIESVRATLAIPIFLETNLVALLTLDSRQSYDAFDIEARNLSAIFSQKITDFVRKSHIQTKLIKEANLKLLFSRCERKISNYKLGLHSLPRLAQIILKAKDLSVDKISLLEINDEPSSSCISYSINKGKLEKSIIKIKEETRDTILGLINNRNSPYIDDFKDDSQFGKSLYLAPIKEHNEIKAIAIVSANSPYAFDLEEYQFLENSYSCLSKLIEKQKVESKLEQLSIFRKAIVDISDEFLGDSPESDFYHKLLIKAIEIIPEINKGSVLLLKEDNRYHFETTVGFDLDSLQKITFIIEEFPFDYNLSKRSFIVKNLSTVVIPNLNKKRVKVLQKSGHIDQIKVTLYIPIQISGILQGFFCLDSTTNYHIEPSSQEMAQILGRQVANMLQRTQILRQTQQQAKSYEKLFKKSERQRQKLSILNNIIQYATQETNINRLLQKTVDIISKTLNNNYITIILFEEDSLNIFNPNGYTPSPLIKDNIEKGIGVIPEVARTGEKVFLRDVSKAKNYIGDGRTKIRSEIAVALKIDKEIIGVLNIEHTKELDEEDSKLAQSLVKQLSLSITRAKLFKQVNKSESQLKLLAEYSKDIISLHDLDGRRKYLSPSIKEVCGYSPEELLEEPSNDQTHPDDLEKIRNHWQKLAQECHQNSEEQTTAERALIYRKKHKSGEYIWLESLTNPIFDANGEKTGYVASTRDISERIELEETLRQQALYDELTGLANRRLFLDRVEQALKRSQRKTEKFAILFFNLDRFKLVNDSYGHVVGDSLLIEISQRLKLILREGDTAARISGDGFCILIEEIDSESDALEITDRVQKVINQVFIYDGREINISASFGLAFKQRHDSNANDLLRDADIAMHEAKQENQKGKLTIFNTTMHKKIVKRMQTENSLYKAIERNELKLAYQPIFNIINKEVVGFEALLRWHHKESGTLIGPDYFIPIAEESGLIKDIDFWVLGEAARQIVKWRTKYKNNELAVSVNLTARTLEQNNFLDILESTITKTGIKSHELHIELTERTIMQDPEKGINMLKELQKRNIEIHVDDFGTGYSSLNYLHKLPFDVLKIDRSFVNLIGQENNQALIETIVTLAKLRKLKIIAEGIETKEQLDTLVSLGCQYGQGWYFSKALEPKQIEENYFINSLVTA